MSIKENLIKLLSDNINYDAIYNDNLPAILAHEIIKLFPPKTIKTQLYYKALERELKDKYEEDKYGTSCRACGAHNPIAKKIFHYWGCPTGQIERILSI